jgi:hypothetical protein
MAIGPVIEVDTTAAVDVREIADRALILLRT